MPEAAYEDLAQAVRELAERIAKNTSLRAERYRVVSRAPLRLDGIDSDQVLDEDDDDVEIFGDVKGVKVGDVVAVTRDGGEYLVTIPGGAPAEVLPGSGDKNYVHTQGTPNTIWNVVHNLDKYPSVTVVDSGNSVVIPNVAYVDADVVQLTFGSATSGKAYVN